MQEARPQDSAPNELRLIPRWRHSPIEPESSTRTTVSNSASLARSIAISIGMFHCEAIRCSAPVWAIRAASGSSEPGG